MLAAGLAAAAVVAGLASLDRPAASSDAVAAGEAGGRATTLSAGTVAVPIELATSSVAQALGVGDIVDVVGVSGTERATASVVAAHARVIDLPAASGFGSASSSVIVIAVDESDALEVTAAAANGELSVLIRERSPR